MDRAYNQRQHLANWEKTAASRAGAKQRLMANIYISAVPGSLQESAYCEGKGCLYDLNRDAFSPTSQRGNFSLKGPPKDKEAMRILLAEPLAHAHACGVSSSRPQLLPCRPQFKADTNIMDSIAFCSPAMPMPAGLPSVTSATASLQTNMPLMVSPPFPITRPTTDLGQSKVRVVPTPYCRQNSTNVADDSAQVRIHAYMPAVHKSTPMRSRRASILPVQHHMQGPCAITTDATSLPYQIPSTAQACIGKCTAASMRPAPPPQAQHLLDDLLRASWVSTDKVRHHAEGTVYTVCSTRDGNLTVLIRWEVLQGRQA
eukprot:458237-Pelagomonas_calceolata.AAC.18